jgi:hypothetical protein
MLQVSYIFVRNTVKTLTVDQSTTKQTDFSRFTTVPLPIINQVAVQIDNSPTATSDRKINVGTNPGRLFVELRPVPLVARRTIALLPFYSKNRHNAKTHH